MCKHILFNNFNSNTDFEIIKEFARRSQNESCGYGYVIRTTNGDIEWTKNLSVESFYFDLGQRLALGDVATLVVHHRTSTNKAGVEYAHPFEFKGHYLTHNGVVSVPGKHNTKTTNDSEALLHHLIKTNWDTETISGYFSCFVLTNDKTIVLVDDIAPIFTDGRVYSSHKLGDDWYSIQLTRLTLDVSGELIDVRDIKTTKSTYGYDQMGRSLGGYTFDIEQTDANRVYDLVDILSDQEIEYIRLSSRHNQVLTIKELALELCGYQLTDKEVDTALEAIDFLQIKEDYLCS